MVLSIIDLDTLEREARKSTTFRYCKFDEYILIRDLSKSISYTFELDTIDAYKSKSKSNDSSDDSLSDSSDIDLLSDSSDNDSTRRSKSYTSSSKMRLVRITNESSKPYTKHLFDRHSIISMIPGNLRVLDMSVDKVSITQPTTTPAFLTVGEFKYEYADTTPLFNMREIRITFKKNSHEKADLNSVVINRTGRCEFITITVAGNIDPSTLMIKHLSSTSEDPITYLNVANVSRLIPTNYTNKEWRTYAADLFNDIVACAFYKQFMY